MSLTARQADTARKQLIETISPGGRTVMTYTSPELGQAITDADDWINTPSVIADFESSLRAGNFKTNASDDLKRSALQAVLDATT